MHIQPHNPSPLWTPPRGIIRSASRVRGRKFPQVAVYGKGASGGGGGPGIAPTIDGHAQCTVSPGDFSGNTTSNVSLVTTKAHDLIVYVLAVEKTATPHLTGSSVVATGLTFTKRSSVYLDNASGTYGQSWNSLEVWSAQAASAGTFAITSTISGAGDTGGSIAFGVNYDGTSYPLWTSNAPLTATLNSSGIPSIGSVATNKAALVFGFTMNAVDTVQTAGSGFTLGADQPVFVNGALASTLAYQSKSFTTAQSGLSVPFGTSWVTWSMIADAIEAPV